LSDIFLRGGLTPTERTSDNWRVRFTTSRFNVSLEFRTLHCAWVPCNVGFVPSVPWQRFCSNKCRMDHANARRKAAMELLGDSPIPVAAMVGTVGAST
jgi:predicted nucleic acid-binding Zn ribbon protein